VFLGSLKSAGTLEKTMFCQHFARTSLSCTRSASSYVTKLLNSSRFVSLTIATRNASTFKNTRLRLYGLQGQLEAPFLRRNRVDFSFCRYVHVSNRLCNGGNLKALQTSTAKKADLSRILSLAKTEKYRLIGRWLR